MLGVFDDEEELVHATEELVSAKIEIFDIYTPFPVHGLDDLLNIKRSRLPIITFIAGVIGLVVSIGFQVWTSAFSWPINVGGKPMFSIPAFVPVSFEVTVLFGALITVGFFFLRSCLYPSKVAVLFHPRQTDDKFILALECSGAKFDEEKLGEKLRVLGASEVDISYK